MENYTLSVLYICISNKIRNPWSFKNVIEVFISSINLYRLRVVIDVRKGVQDSGMQ